MADGKDVVETCQFLKIPRRTFYDWQGQHPEFRALCVLAREALADYDAKRIRDEISTIDKDNANAKRVSISALQWFAERRAPRSYGNKQTTEITGKDGGPVQIEAKTIQADQLDEDALDAIEMALAAAVEAE
jgi:hypothetical protein